MKFRFYITDLFDGVINGTNDENTASEYAVSSDFFVVDSELGVWLTEDGKEEVNEVASA